MNELLESDGLVAARTVPAWPEPVHEAPTVLAELSPEEPGLALGARSRRIASGGLLDRTNEPRVAR
ncbi:MAG: hypothetical protein ABSF89_17145 [Acidimicrobiales bacterium]